MPYSEPNEPAGGLNAPDQNLRLPQTPEYLTSLRRVGWALVIGGVIDLGYMIYCIAQGTSYSSSFNIFAVIAGIFLIRGNLKASRNIAWAVAFLLTGLTGVLVGIPLITPVGLIATYTKLHAAEIIPTMIFAAVILALLFWAYRELMSPAVADARAAAGVDSVSFWRRPRNGFWFGAAFVATIMLAVHSFTTGPTADRAKELAAQQVGEGYKLHVSSVNFTHTSDSSYYRAVVTAYDDTEIKDVMVSWSDDRG